MKSWWATLGLLALGCSGGSLGSAGTGGTGGVLTGEGPGNGGRTGGAGVSATLELPGCLRDLLAPCAPQGTCAEEPLGPEALEACFETGVRASSGYMMSSEACPYGDLYVYIRKPDGTLCYRYEAYIPASLSCEVTQHTWKDAAGNVVATGTSGSSPNWTTAITCAESGETAICGEPTALPMDGCCGVSRFGAAACTAGVQTSCPAGICPGSTGRGGMGGGTAGAAGGMGGGLAGVGGDGRGGLGGMAGGTAGAAGGGGSRGGRGGNSGSGTGGMGDLELPNCVKALVAACPTEGTCTYAQADASGASNTCYASGVRVSYGALSSTLTQQVRVTKADGSPCYSFETVLGELTLYTWKDAAGQVVATGSYLGPTRSAGIVCANGGESRSCQGSMTSDPSAGPCCTISGPGNATCASPSTTPCTAGSCP